MSPEKFEQMRLALIEAENTIETITWDNGRGGRESTHIEGTDLNDHDCGNVTQTLKLIAEALKDLP